MDAKLQKIKQIFNKIKDTRIQVVNVFGVLEVKIGKLKLMTNDFIKNNHDALFVFSLDSFKFQSKLIDFEYADMQKHFYALNNRMYCEYYKLFKIISEYIDKTLGANKTFEMIKTNSNFPIYKDLEPYKQYNFETIEEVHKTIILLLTGIQEHIVSKETELDDLKVKQHAGLNINNFVNTFEFNVLMVRHNLGLFISYLDFFHNIHIKHFKRFSKKMKSMDDYLNEDIAFDETPRRKGSKDFDDLSSVSSTNSSINSKSNNNHTHNNNNKAKAVPRKSETKNLLKKGVDSVISTFRVFQPKTEVNNLHDGANIINLSIEENEETDKHNLDSFINLPEFNMTKLSQEHTELINEKLTNDPQYMNKIIDKLTKTIYEDDNCISNNEEDNMLTKLEQTSDNIKKEYTCHENGNGENDHFGMEEVEDDLDINAIISENAIMELNSNNALLEKETNTDPLNYKKKANKKKRK
jgi:hypothetical protein